MVWSRQGNRGQGIHAILNPSSSSLENRERCAGWRVPNSQRGIATPCDAHVRMRGAGVQGHVKSLERSVCVCARACVHVGGSHGGDGNGGEGGGGEGSGGGGAWSAAQCTTGTTPSPLVPSVFCGVGVEMGPTFWKRQKCAGFRRLHRYRLHLALVVAFSFCFENGAPAAEWKMGGFWRRAPLPATLGVAARHVCCW